MDNFNCKKMFNGRKLLIMEKDERVTIRFSKEEYSILKENVDKEGITLSNYIRNKVSCCNNLIQDIDTGQVNLQNIKKN